jgi:hypothetical protein
MKNDTKEFIEEVKNFASNKGLSLKDTKLLELILLYCDENELDEEEIGVMLSKDKGITSILEKEMIEEKLHNVKKYSIKEEESLEDF